MQAPLPLLLLLSLLTPGCGGAWIPSIDWHGSESSEQVLRIVDREPAHDPSGAAALFPVEPLEHLSLTFDAPIDIGSVRGSAGVAGAAIRVYREDPELVPATPNVLPELIDDLSAIDLERDALGNVTDPNRVVVELEFPLTLLQGYHVRLAENTIRTAGGGRTLRRDDVLWTFTVRDGVLQPENLVSFLQPIGGVNFLPDGGTGLVIEGRDFFSANFVIGLASAPAGGDFGPPSIIRNTPLETNQNGLALSNDFPERMAIAWMEGRPWYNPNGVPVEPQGDLYVSVSETGIGGWSPSAAQVPIDGAVAPAGGGKKLSWPLSLRFDALGQIVTTFWVFRETNTSSASAASFSEYDQFGVWSAVRDSVGWQPAAPVALPPAGKEFGWPFLARERTSGALHALWAEADRKEDFFNDAGGADPELLTGYWLASFDPAQGWTARRVVGTTPGLPRPSDFALTETGLALVVAGSAAAGPRVFAIDLSTADLLGDQTLSGPALAPASDVFDLPTGKQDFAPLRATVRTTFPRLTYLDGGEALVPWKALDGTVQVARVDLARLGDPLLSLFDPPVTVIQEPLGFQVVQGPAIQADLNGALTMFWTSSGPGPGGEPLRTVQLSRAPNGNPTALATGAITISDPALGCASGATGDTHPSGQRLFGWTYKDCNGSSFLFSSLRRFE